MFCILRRRKINQCGAQNCEGRILSRFSSNLGQLKTRERLRDESEEEEYNAEENEETDNENDKTPSEKNPKN